MVLYLHWRVKPSLQLFVSGWNMIKSSECFGIHTHMCFTALWCALLCCTVLVKSKLLFLLCENSNAQCIAVQHCAAKVKTTVFTLWKTATHSALQCSTVLHCAALCCTVLVKSKLLFLLTGFTLWKTAMHSALQCSTCYTVLHCVGKVKTTGFTL